LTNQLASTWGERRQRSQGWSADGAAPLLIQARDDLQCFHSGQGFRNGSWHSKLIMNPAVRRRWDDLESSLIFSLQSVRVFAALQWWRWRFCRFKAFEIQSLHHVCQVLAE
jgi:hypothetical protein